jgi:hypothetical protein
MFTPLTGWHCKLRPNTEGPMTDVLLSADAHASPYLQWIIDGFGWGTAIEPPNDPAAGIAVTQLLTAFTIAIEIGSPLLFFWPIMYVALFCKSFIERFKVKVCVTRV